MVHSTLLVNWDQMRSGSGNCLRQTRRARRCAHQFQERCDATIHRRSVGSTGWELRSSQARNSGVSLNSAALRNSGDGLWLGRMCDDTLHHGRSGNFSTVLYSSVLSASGNLALVSLFFFAKSSVASSAGHISQRTPLDYVFRFPVQIEDFVLRSQIIFRMAVTFQTPGHAMRLGLINDRHVIDLPWQLAQLIPRFTWAE